MASPPDESDKDKDVPTSVVTNPPKEDVDTPAETAKEEPGATKTTTTDLAGSASEGEYSLSDSSDMFSHRTSGSSLSAPFTAGPDQWSSLSSLTSSGWGSGGGWGTSLATRGWGAGLQGVSSYNTQRREREQAEERERKRRLDALTSSEGLAQLATLLTSKHPPQGLSNLGNTCFLNSALQVLSSSVHHRASLARCLTAQDCDTTPSEGEGEAEAEGVEAEGEKKGEEVSEDGVCGMGEDGTGTKAHSPGMGMGKRSPHPHHRSITSSPLQMQWLRFLCSMSNAGTHGGQGVVPRSVTIHDLYRTLGRTPSLSQYTDGRQHDAHAVVCMLLDELDFASKKAGDTSSPYSASLRSRMHQVDLESAMPGCLKRVLVRGRDREAEAEGGEGGDTPSSPRKDVLTPTGSVTPGESATGEGETETCTKEVAETEPVQAGGSGPQCPMLVGGGYTSREGMDPEMAAYETLRGWIDTDHPAAPTPPEAPPTKRPSPHQSGQGMRYALRSGWGGRQSSPLDLRVLLSHLLLPDYVDSTYVCRVCSTRAAIRWIGQLCVKLEAELVGLERQYDSESAQDVRDSDTQRERDAAYAQDKEDIQSKINQRKEILRLMELVLGVEMEVAATGGEFEDLLRLHPDCGTDDGKKALDWRKKIMASKTIRRMTSVYVRQFRVGSPPKSVLVHLKRFSQSSSSQGMDDSDSDDGYGSLYSGYHSFRGNSRPVLAKDSRPVSFPETLDISALYYEDKHQAERVYRDRVSGVVGQDLAIHPLPVTGGGGEGCVRAVYRLRGVVEHHGSLGGGHYTASTRADLASGQTWFKCNDSHISRTQVQSVLGGSASSASVLLYEMD
ncbi:hypothetical protein KIPB_000410 [Kipferlia bialata]|uniref:Ubiquitin carboxyl-terminal hydrolase n=1 Tax=Kipferlia bialata TaxID=797122 RepID=A0A9K3GEN2_9EUKA|nr:hypothetical protein KIPB_000410 [Kipferlia bialata]|eukprot:g410.t1